MNPVTQEDNYGCSLACIAFLAKKPYMSVALLAGKQQAQTKGFSCKELVMLLKLLDFNYGYKYIKPRFKKLIYRNFVIVFIRRSKRFPSGHYLIRFNVMWMDPWINFRPSAKITDAKSGFRKRLPGSAIYALFPGHYLTKKDV